ncbi:TadE/TadG family type IV pilus assembly protein [Sphingomonas quercus]|uniref:Pilus assembly protein n=1 Tax=Sphingomonas quercus TaxID=2842451 RepID=A0ABS6BM17_9SPHN|nr:TadE family protein [Sphingomonas quercus]MBU3079358.1 pilus assembly protein [Sphingomonas quercus]
MIEFATILPLFLVAVLLGSDYAWYVVTRQQVASVARMTADNASRIGEDDPADIKKASEAAIIDLLQGGIEQGGSLDMAQRGRIILSSYERWDGARLVIKWQRCAGALAYDSSQGHEGDVRPQGMGVTGVKPPPLPPPIGGSASQPGSQPPPDAALMFVEVAYEYRPLFGHFWNAGNRIVEMAAFRTREKRDLTQVYNSEGVAPATCAT